MKLNQQFAQFIRDIKPTDPQKASWKSGSDTLRQRLDNDETLSPLIVSTFLQGSIRRSTAVRPKAGKRPDVDIVVVTTIDSESETPIDAMERFVPFLEKWYKEKWQPQGRSFGIEMSLVDLDLVITALPKDPEARSALLELYKTDAVRTLDTLDERDDWQLSKRWHTDIAESASTFSAADAIPQKDWKPHPLWLPDRDVGAWGRTHPLAQIQWTADKNRATNKHYTNVVRALKWWRHENRESLPKYPKGYPLEHMIGCCLPDGVETLAEGITLTLEAMRDTWAVWATTGVVPTLADHGVPEHNVLKRLDAADFKAFVKAASEAADTAREALDNADAQESGALWRKLLGSSFPLPGPGGGDRSRTFATPTAAAAPAKSDRFA